MNEIFCCLIFQWHFALPFFLLLLCPNIFKYTLIICSLIKFLSNYSIFRKWHIRFNNFGLSSKSSNCKAFEIDTQQHVLPRATLSKIRFQFCAFQSEIRPSNQANKLLASEGGNRDCHFHFYADCCMSPWLAITNCETFSRNCSTETNTKKASSVVLKHKYIQIDRQTETRRCDNSKWKLEKSTLQLQATKVSICSHSNVWLFSPLFNNETFDWAVYFCFLPVVLIFSAFENSFRIATFARFRLNDFENCAKRWCRRRKNAFETIEQIQCNYRDP